MAAFIRRGIAVPFGTPPEFTDVLIDAMRAVTEDQAFRIHAEAIGYQVMWNDGATWLTKIQEEQAVLAKLWETDPWLSSSGG